MKPMKMVSQSQISLNSAMTKSFSPQKYKVKSRYRGFFKNKRKHKKFESTVNINFMKRGRKKLKKKHGNIDTTCGTVLGGMVKQQSDSTLGEFVQRQFTIDQIRYHNPVLHGDSGERESGG